MKLSLLVMAAAATIVSAASIIKKDPFCDNCQSFVHNCKNVSGSFRASIVEVSNRKLTV
jgi:hypothetical protein